MLVGAKISWDSLNGGFYTDVYSFNFWSVRYRSPVLLQLMVVFGNVEAPSPLLAKQLCGPQIQVKKVHPQAQYRHQHYRHQHYRCPLYNNNLYGHQPDMRLIPDTMISQAKKKLIYKLQLCKTF